MTFKIEIDLKTLDGADRFTIPGAAAEGAIRAISTGPVDINGDGFDDAVFSTANDRAIILFGDGTPPPSSVTFDDLDGADGFRIEVGANSDFFPYNAAEDGDFNGDGVYDIAFSGRRIFTHDGGDELGEAIIVFGANPAPAFDDSEDATDIADVLFAGLYDNDGFGRGLAFPDINGDTVDDFIISAPLGDRENISSIDNAGEVFAVFGGTAVSGQVDVAALDGADGFKLKGVGRFDDTGFTVSSAGGFKDDGVEDIIVSASRGAARPGEGDGSH